MPALTPETWAALWLSAKIAVFALPAYALAAVLLCYALQFGLKHPAWLDALVTVPLVFPPVVIGFGLLWLLGRESLLGRGLQTLGINLIFTFPGLLLAAFLAGLLLALARGMGEVGISLMLGGNILGRTETLSLAIFNAVTAGDYAQAGLLSALLGGFSLVLFIAVRVLQNKELAKRDVLHPG